MLHGLMSEAGVAGLYQAVGHVRYHGVVGVIGLAAAAYRRGIHPRHGDAIALGLGKIFQAAGFVPDQPANVDRKLAAATEAGLGSRAANFTLFAVSVDALACAA